MDLRGCLSYCFWGRTSGPYFDGITLNVERASKFYPGWDIAIFLPRNVHSVLAGLSLGSNVRIIPSDLNECWNGMFWRMLPIFWNDYTHLCIRDLDSLVSQREADATKEWINDNTDLHIMRDHPAHTAPIMGGMFGVKVNEKTRHAFRPIKKIILDSEIHNNEGYWQIDQVFLANTVYPALRDSATIHDPYYKKTDFPTPREEPHLYVGRPTMKLGPGRVIDDESILLVDEYLNQKAHILIS
jgi:hypothetical protein